MAIGKNVRRLGLSQGQPSAYAMANVNTVNSAIGEYVQGVQLLLQKLHRLAQQFYKPCKKFSIINDIILST